MKLERIEELAKENSVYCNFENIQYLISDILEEEMKNNPDAPAYASRCENARSLINNIVEE